MLISKVQGEKENARTNRSSAEGECVTVRQILYPRKGVGQIWSISDNFGPLFCFEAILVASDVHETLPVQGETVILVVVHHT